MLHVPTPWPKPTFLPPHVLPVPLHSKSKPRIRSLGSTKGALNQYFFVPFAVETLGPFGEKALALVQDLGRRICDNTGEIRSKLFLTQRNSIAIQRGNAASIFSTIPSSSKLNEIYYL
jgi:hypothetical protein